MSTPNSIKVVMLVTTVGETTNAPLPKEIKVFQVN